MRLIFFIILFGINSYAYSASGIENKNRNDLYNIFCHYTSSILNVLKKESRIPNSLDHILGTDAKKVDIYQPRFLQITNNILLISKINNEFKNYCNVDAIINETSRVFFKFSNNLSIYFPHLFHLNGKTAYTYPRNIYEMGDWLGISLIQESLTIDKRISEYNLKQIEKLYYLLKNNNNGFYDYYFNKRNGRYEIGHLTLAIDSLTIYSYKTQNLKFVNLALELIKKQTTRHLVEDLENNQFTHLATYGEIFESYTFANYVKNETYQKDVYFEKLYYEMKSRFQNDSGFLTYIENKNCYHTLAYEAAFLRPLLYFYYNNNFKEVDFLNNQILHLEEKLGVPPIVGKCSDSKIFEKLNHSTLGTYYMYLKIKRVQSILGLDKNAEDKISKVISSFFTSHYTNFFGKEIANNLNNFSGDMGGNVWFFNEGIVPLLFSYIEPHSLIGKNASFQGCNFYYVKGFDNH